MDPSSHYTEPTTQYWQTILPANCIANPRPPWQFAVPVELPDGRFLMLPIRQLPGNPNHAVASLLVNAASFDVQDALADMMAEKLRKYEVDVIAGLPTLGHALCPGIAKGLGLRRFVPLGYSQKFWFDTRLSTPVSSITSPELGQKRLWIDPHHLPLLLGCRVAIVDDAVSSGTTMRAAWELLESLGVDVVATGVAMMQGMKWKQVLGEERAGRLVGVFESPLLERVEGGWGLRA